MNNEKVGEGWIEIKSESDLPDPKVYDWVLIKIKMIPENYYGVPHIAEYRNGKWMTDMYSDIEKECSVKVTHWRPIPED